jgi:hypothetical protein
MAGRRKDVQFLNAPYPILQGFIFECPFLNSLTPGIFTRSKEGQPQNASLSILSALRQSTSTMLGCRWNARSGMTFIHGDGDMSCITKNNFVVLAGKNVWNNNIALVFHDGTADRTAASSQQPKIVKERSESENGSCERADFRFRQDFSAFSNDLSAVGTKDFFRSG